MPTVHVERERTYDVDEGAELPPLADALAAGDAGVPARDGPWSEDAPASVELAATYFDTPDLDLAAARLTLRRRTGGDDAGWHLKVPLAESARSEVRLPPTEGTDTVPAQLRAMTHARTGGRDLVPVARVETHRTVRRLLDRTGRVLLELADDRVTATPLRAGDADRPVAAPSTWREVEVELVDGPPELLAAVDPVLRGWGLRPSETGSKLARTLGGAAIEAARAATAERGHGEVGTTASAADVVLAYLRVQVEQIRAQDLPVRLGAEGSVHAMRVATRRARSTLAVFRPLLRGSVTRPVAAELRWLARALGAARDAEVLRERVAAALAGEPDLAADAVADGVLGPLDAALAAARDALVAELDGERYRSLLDRLTELLEHPPVKARASRPARRVLPGLVAHADADVRAAVRGARRATGPGEREDGLHDARKAAKRARYAAEAAAPACGKRARRYAAAMEGVQEVVGEHLDAVHTRARLEELARGTSEPGVAFTLGRLHAREDEGAERARRAFRAAWAEAKGERLRRWLD